MEVTPSASPRSAVATSGHRESLSGDEDDDKDYENEEAYFSDRSSADEAASGSWRTPIAQGSPHSMGSQSGGGIDGRVYRRPPLQFQDPKTFEQRRRHVVRRLQVQRSEFVDQIKAKWQHEEDLRVARLESAQDVDDDAERALSRVEGWAPAIVIALHFKLAWETVADEIRATNNLRFFLLPLCVLYIRRLRKRLRLRNAFAQEAAKGSTKLDRPTAATLKLSSPLLAKWPDAALQALSAAMKPKYYNADDAIFLRAEYARKSFVHYLARGIITVPDATENHDHLTTTLSDLALMESARQLGKRSAHDAPVQLHTITSGSTIGDFSVFVGERYRYSYHCRTDCVVYSIDGPTFLQIVSTLPVSIFNHMSTNAKNRFKRRVVSDRPNPEMIRQSHPFFASWANDPISCLLECGSPSVFRLGERIFRDSRTTNRIYFIISGSVTTEVRHRDVTKHRLPIGTTIGTESIVPVVCPALDGELIATADTFVEVWSFPRSETMNVMNRFQIMDRVLAEFPRVVVPQLPPVSVDAVRRANVFNFLPDKPALRIAESFTPFVVLPETVLVRQDLVVSEMLIVIWGSVQLVTTESRSRERKVVGELHSGVTFGASEVVAQAVANVSVIATNSTIVATVPKAAVFAAIEMGGKNLYLSVLDRANQLVGGRSAEARARLEEEMQAARLAMERDENPQQKIDEARARCADRVREVRQAQRVAAENEQSRELQQHKEVIAKLTQDARRARELQKLTVEHRVFACIESQVYGGARNEHTEIVAKYYAQPFDHDEPTFADQDTDELLSEGRSRRSAADAVVHHKMTGAVAVALDDVASIQRSASPTQQQVVLVAAPLLEVAQSSGRRKLSPPPPSRSIVKPRSVRGDAQVRNASSSGAAQAHRNSSTVSCPPTRTKRAKEIAGLIVDPLPGVLPTTAPLPPPPPAVVVDMCHKKEDILDQVQRRCKQRREHHAKEVAALFHIPSIAVAPPAAAISLPPVMTVGDDPIAANEVPPQAQEVERATFPSLPKTSRLTHHDSTHQEQPQQRWRGHVGPYVRPSPPPPPQRNVYPDMRITVDRFQFGRSVGGIIPTGTIAKGRPEPGVSSRKAPIPLQ